MTEIKVFYIMDSQDGRVSRITIQMGQGRGYFKVWLLTSNDSFDMFTTPRSISAAKILAAVSDRDWWEFEARTYEEWETQVYKLFDRVPLLKSVLKAYSHE